MLPYGFGLIKICYSAKSVNVVRGQGQRPKTKDKHKNKHYVVASFSVGTASVAGLRSRGLAKSLSRIRRKYLRSLRSL